MKKLVNWIGIFLIVSFLLAGQFAAPARAAGTIRHVTPTGLNTGTCGTWATACNLQRSLTVVAVSGDQVWVKQGTYKPTSGTDRTVSFVLKNGVKIYGGFAGTESALSQRNPATHVTILSGNIGQFGDLDNSYHVVVASGVVSTAVLDGFTITKGYADSDLPYNHGGGMFIDEDHPGSPTLVNLTIAGNYAYIGGGFSNAFGSPTLSHVTFSGNHAAVDGGGLASSDGSPTLTDVTFHDNSTTDPAGDGGGMENFGSGTTLTNVIFSGNHAAVDGGGFYNDYHSNPKLTNVTFSGNSANQGGGISNKTGSNPTLTNVTFTGNSAVKGGGMYNDSSSPKLLNVTFSSNSTSSSGDGGGMANTSSSNPTLTNVTFDGNSAYAAAGIYDSFGSNPTLTNVTFHANSATYIGGGMENQNSSPTLTNVTFRGNSAPFNGGGIYNYLSNPVIHDSVLWNDGAEIFNDSSVTTINDSLVAGGCPLGATCSGVLLNTDPLLGPLANNGGFTRTMSLAAGSPAMDAGNNATCAPKDQRGVQRPQGPRCDMGAYEARYMTFRSNGSLDGWVLESGENTRVGGTPNSAAPALTLGDDASRRQYRAVLSFNTSSIPDNAVINSVMLKLKSSSVTPPATNPISLLQGILLDLKDGFFGTSSGLQASDFQAVGTKTVGTYSPVLSGGYYSITLNSSAFASINKLAANGGLTQIRLRFKLDDNNNAVANTLNLISGNNAIPANRPTLIVVYTTP